MMNASRPLVTPEELQCLLGWPLDEWHDQRMSQSEPPRQQGWAAHTPLPDADGQTTAWVHSA